MAKIKRPSARVQPQQEASRLLNAAEFLLSIPMGTRAEPAAGHSRARTAASAAAVVSTVDRPGDRRSGAEQPSFDKSGGEMSVSVRLRGDVFRHITSRGARSSTAFAEALLRERVPDGRIVFSAARAFPSAMTSIIRYDPVAEAAKVKERQAAATRLLLDAVATDAGMQGGAASVPAYLRWRIGRSYHALIRPAEGGPPVITTTGRRAGRSTEDGTDPGYVRRYDPLALDSTEFDKAGARLRYERDGYVVSLLAFRQAGQAKEECNSRFAHAFPWLDFGEGQSLTLSKLRALKLRALGLWWTSGWELSTVALACVALERLVWKRIVTKANRKLAMAACLLLAFKHNEASGEADPRVPPVSLVVTALEAAFSTPRKLLLKAEFPVFVHLGFSLHAPNGHVMPHMDRLLSAKGLSLGEYLSTAD